MKINLGPKIQTFIGQNRELWEFCGTDQLEGHLYGVVALGTGYRSWIAVDEVRLAMWDRFTFTRTP